MHNKNKHITKLLQQCKRGEQSAQFEIYKCYYKGMYNTALRILKDKFEAEDIMQESFLTAFLKLGTFRSKSRFGEDHVPFGSWLKRIVINKSLSQLRKNQRLEQWNDNNLSMNGVDLVEEEQQNINYNTLKAEEILGSIKSLKNNYSVVLTLSLIEGYDNEEIAEILQINNQLVRTTISRAKQKLRKILE